VRLQVAFVALGLVPLGCRVASGAAPSGAPSSSEGGIGAPPTAAPRMPAAAACPALHLDLPPPETVMELDPQPVDVADPHGALSRFFERTALLLRGRAKQPVRIGVYGDSNGTMDFISGQMRRVLQTSHGDAGHGFVALARPWKWYGHEDVVADSMRGAWSAFTVTTHPTPDLDPWYGPGLIVAQSRQTGAATWVATAPEGAPVGTRASRFEVWYLRWPPGGSFEMKIDGEVRARVDTHSADPPHFGFVGVDVPDGPHRMTAVARSARPVRLLGAIVERDAPGFQVDGLGVGSLNCLCVLRESESLDREIFAHRPYDLVVFHLGSNTWNPAVLDPVACMKEAIARLRRAVPDVSVLLMTPPDWGLGGSKKPPKWLLAVEDQLHAAADEAPAAFFDFRSAMGGQGSMARFLGLGMTQGDGVHFNAAGGAYVGDRVVDALARAFAVWAQAHPRAGCE
jgi:hypothetical protein